MSEEARPATPDQPGFLRSGWQELGRRLQRRKLRKQAAQLDLQRTAALGQLGQQAWLQKIDLSGHPELRDQTSRLEARAGELTAVSQKLTEERTAFEARRQEEMGKFDAQRQAVEAKQRPVDTSLQAARDRLRTQDDAIKRFQARQAALPAEIESNDRQIASLVVSPETSAQLTVLQNQRQQLELEQKHVAEQLALAQQGTPLLAGEVRRLFDESQRYKEEINRIEAERKSVLSPILADLDRVQRELASAGQQSTALDQQRQQQFIQLGQALYAGKIADPGLQPNLDQVTAIDHSRAATYEELDHSLSQTQAMRRGVMLKFFGTIALVPVVLIGAAAGAYMYLAPATESSDSPQSFVQQEEDRKADILKSYLRARRDPSKRDSSYEALHRNALGILKDDMRLLADSADPKYLPALAKTLRSDETDLRIAAANTIRAIGPTAAEIPALSNALNDPVPAVRFACLHALLRGPAETHAHLLIGRTLEEVRTLTPSENLRQQQPPDAQKLGLPAYPNAVFLYFASNPAEGRAAYRTGDSVQQVLDFFRSKAQKQPMTPEQFGREYLGPAALDPQTVKALQDKVDNWVSQGAAAAHRPPDPQAQGLSPDLLTLRALSLRYSDERIYGSPTYLVLEEATAGSEKTPTRFVLVFQDHSLDATGFVIHFPPTAQ